MQTFVVGRVEKEEEKKDRGVTLRPTPRILIIFGWLSFFVKFT